MFRLLVIAVLFLGACDKPTDENIEKWANTQKGTGKLIAAFKNEQLSPDLQAHAALVLIKKGNDPDVRQGFEQMTAARRTDVVGKLAPKLWELARVEGELNLPNAPEIRAKDALVLVRKYADAATKGTIDGYLIDWYCVPAYEGRAGSGATQGAAVIRLIGPAAGKKLVHVAEGILAVNRTSKEKKNRIGDELLLALAASGDPDAVKYLLTLAKEKPDFDHTQGERATNALYVAYVEPKGLFDMVPATALVPSIDQITALAKDETLGANVQDDAVRLLRVIGPPACVAPLVSMIGYPSSNPKYKYVAADSALKCGGLAVVKDVVHALPDGPYRRDELFGGVVVDITMMTPRQQALDALRSLLDDKGRIPRWVAIEGLAAMKSVEDAPRLAAIKSSEKLVGFYGDQSGVAAADRKADPTLGQRAKELAAQLK
ncbi:MAG: hypothetical protein QM831_46240 [Kofleriaceae bacterium]